jgi:hypothetical protein
MAGTFGNKKKGSVTEECPNIKGSICVVATRSDNNAPISDVKVALSGPTPGSATTDGMGLNQLDGRDPGSYGYNISFAAPKYKDWVVLAHADAVSVAGGSVSLLEVQAYPTGTLVVEIREEQSGAFIQGAADMTASGPSSLSERIEGGTRSFPRLACGAYTVSARLSAKYQGQTVTAGEVTVTDGGSVVAKIVVPVLTWVEIKLLREDGSAVADEPYVLTAPDGREFPGKTDANGIGRVEGIVPGSCKISFTRLDQGTVEAA